ncbi:MAG: tetratricopeptide repeat protein [Cyclobacteriaceae bacterium]
MAKTKNGGDGLDLIENPDAIVSKTEEFFNDKKNQNVVFGIGGVLAALVLGYLGFNYYTTNRNIEAQDEMFQAVYYFEADSLTKALNGDGNSYGFLDITDLYSGTAAANLSNFYIGTIYLRLKEYDNAIRHFGEFSSSDALVQARAFSLIGDAYMEQDDFDNAVNYFKKAASHKPNKDFSPVYLNKLGLASELNGDLAGAIEAYNEIIDKYFESTMFQEAKKQKARLEGLQAE